MRRAASAALDQAASRDYSAALRQAEVPTLYTLGLASHGKRIALASTVRSLPDGAPSEPTYHLAGPEPEPTAQKAPKSGKGAKGKSRPSADMLANEGQKIHLAGRIQLLQELKGETPLSLEQLLGMDLLALETIHNLLKPKTPPSSISHEG